MKNKIVWINDERFQVEDNDNSTIPYRLYQEDRKKTYYAFDLGKATYTICDFGGRTFAKVKKELLTNPTIMATTGNTVTVHINGQVYQYPTIQGGIPFEQQVDQDGLNRFIAPKTDAALQFPDMPQWKRNLLNQGTFGFSQKEVDKYIDLLEDQLYES